MSTCIRNGVRYNRHWYDDDNVCQQCGNLSPWAKEQLLKRQLDRQIAEVTDIVDSAEEAQLGRVKAGLLA